MKAFKSILVTSAFALCTIGGQYNPPAVAAHTYGDAIPVGVPISLNPAPTPVAAPQPDVYSLNDSQAQAVAARFADPEVVAHMLHRVTTPLPEQPAGRWSVQNYFSGNYSGYIADTSGTGRAVTGAYGRFNAEQLPFGPGIGTNGSWIGIGGKNGPNLIQAGVSYQNPKAFVELLPAQPVYYFNVRAGDQMYAATIKDNSTGFWYVLVEDLSTSVYYANEYNYSPDTSTADWITEVQPYSGPAPFLSTPVNFSQAYWTFANSTSLQLTSPFASTLWKTTMQDPYGGQYCPSNVGGDGISFSISSC